MLQKILAATRQRIERLPSTDELVERTIAAPPVRDFESALLGEGLSMVAEVKRRSPSLGDLALDLDPGSFALCYAARQAGMAALVEAHTEDAARMQVVGPDAVLVRESLVRSADPAVLISELRVAK